MVNTGQVIYIALNDPNLGEELASQIVCFGYQAHLFMTSEPLIEAVKMRQPDFIVIDTDFHCGDGHGIELVASLQNEFALKSLTVFLSRNDNLETRLACVRANGGAFITQPAEISRVLEVLETLSEKEVSEPYRVLIIEDSRAQAYFISSTLESAGIKTLVVNEPLELMQKLVDFQPELILMDIYLPDCSGLELAHVIRQQESYVSIPIVFLSAEQDMGHKFRAMQLGGDDFLTKPITPEHLISAIYSRVARSRRLRGYMIRDSLTGLLNHTNVLERLESEISRSCRQGSKLCFAMMDIDHFKQVNDTYGHAAGDRVIKSLAHLLQQRLRKTDTIGRYGGEEFAVILPETDLSQAQALLEEIRVSFAGLRQFAGDSVFNCSFSAGIAQLAGDDAQHLAECADGAMYRAKRSGRNQVILHPKSIMPYEVSCTA